MKKFVLKLFSLFACVVLFSCSDIFQDKVNGNSSNGANLVLNISNGGKGFARTVTSCSGFDIASLEWNVEIFPVVDGVVSETAIEAENQGTDGTYSYTILTGTYFITVSSEFTDSENVKHTIYGEASDVEIAEDSTTPVAISVGLKKTAEGTGTFGPYEISVPKTILKYSESYSFNVGLKKTTNKKEKADYAWEFADVTSDENNLLLSMEAKTVDSGFYHIIIHYSVDGTDFEEIYASDELVEIGDDETVTGGQNAVAQKKGGNGEFGFVLLPNFEILATTGGTELENGRTLDYESSDKIVFALSEAEFDENTTFDWYVNEKLVAEGEDSSFEFDLDPRTTTGYLNLDGTNVVTVEATAGMQIKTASFEFGFANSWDLVFEAANTSNCELVRAKSFSEIASGTMLSVNQTNGSNISNLYTTAKDGTIFWINSQSDGILYSDKDGIKTTYTLKDSDGKVFNYRSSYNFENAAVAMAYDDVHNRLAVFYISSPYYYLDVIDLNQFENGELKEGAGDCRSRMQVVSDSSDFDFSDDTVLNLICAVFDTSNEVPALYLTYQKSEDNCYYYAFGSEDLIDGTFKLGTDKIEDILAATGIAFGDDDRTASKKYINDMYIDFDSEAVYFLVSEHYRANSVGDDDKYISRGAISKFSLNGELQTSWAVNGSYGWSDNSFEAHYSTNSGCKLTVYSPDRRKGTFDGFFEPMKFIAVRNKKMIIKEGGGSVFKDDERLNGTDGENVHDFVVLDLETQISTYVKTQKSFGDFGYSGSVILGN